MNRFHALDDELMAMKPECTCRCLETAEVSRFRARYTSAAISRTNIARMPRRVGAACRRALHDESVPFNDQMAVVQQGPQGNH